MVLLLLVLFRCFILCFVVVYSLYHEFIAKITKPVATTQGTKIAPGRRIKSHRLWGTAQRGGGALYDDNTYYCCCRNIHANVPGLFRWVTGKLQDVGDLLEDLVVASAFEEVREIFDLTGIEGGAQQVGLRP